MLIFFSPLQSHHLRSDDDSTQTTRRHTRNHDRLGKVQLRLSNEWQYPRNGDCTRVDLWHLCGVIGVVRDTMAFVDVFLAVPLFDPVVYQYFDGVCVLQHAR